MAGPAAECSYFGAVGLVRCRRAWPALYLVALAAAFASLAACASAETPIANASTDTLLVLDITGSPYVLDHDFHVLPGGFLLVSDGVELRMDNGSKLIGDGGSISATGSSAAPALLGPRPFSNFTTWGGIELQNGSVLTLRHARVVSTDRAITFLGVATLDAQFAEFSACGAWCVNTTTDGTLLIRDSSARGGEWGIVEGGSTNPSASNISLREFTVGGVWLGSGLQGGVFSAITIVDAPLGIWADGSRGTSLGGLLVTTIGGAVMGNGTVDLMISDSTLTSSAGAAADLGGSLRLTLQRSSLSGATRALALHQSVAAALLSNVLSAPAGECLYLSNVTNALFRLNALAPCLLPVAFDSSAAPPTADADGSNTVNGKPWLWVANAAGVEVGVFDDPGLIVLSSVGGANLTDLRLNGSGIYLFGSSDVRVERVLVENAPAGLTAIGTRRLQISQFVVRNVTNGIVIRSSPFFTAPQDCVLNHTRVDGASADGIVVAGASNLTVIWTHASAQGAGVNLSGVQGALLDHLDLDGGQVGLDILDSGGVTVVDSVIRGTAAYGMRATNTTGIAARNAFLSTAGEHASAPSSPSFLFYEAGGGNYWDGFTGPNANGDAFFDIPYNLTDGTGQDARPRVARLDFRPAVVVAAPRVVDVGIASALDASFSFDDFAVSTIYWIIDVPGRNDTASGPVYLWAPNATGNFSVTVSAVDSAGAVDEYVFTVFVRDRVAPTLGDILIGLPELGANLTVVIANATDNDRAFPQGARVLWTLSLPPPLCCLSSTGASDNFSFEVPIFRLGPHSLFITLVDAAGNTANGSVSFEVFDTQPPEVDILVSGEPDLGVPFAVDASQARDPVGVDNGTAEWRWTDSGAPFTSKDFPVLSITFAQAGNHTVVLRLCDVAGNCGNTSVTLDARDRSAPRLTVLRVLVPGRDPVEVVPGQDAVVTVLLNEETVFEIVGQDASGSVRYLWDFGDGGTAEGARVTHRFSNLGAAVVTVVMVDAFGNANTTGLGVRVEGGGIFGTLIPGGNLGALLLVLGIGGAVALTVSIYRWRSKYRKNY